MKKTLIRAGIAATALVASTAALAGGPDVTHANPWYGNIYGGISFLGNVSETASNGSQVTKENHNGYLWGFAVGYQMQNWRLEGQFGYVSNDAKDLRASGVIADVGGDTKAYTYMLNGYYDFTNAWRQFTPYLGIGLGAAHVKEDVKNNATPTQGYSGNDTLFAYQVIAGIKYNFMPNWSANLEYRYLGTTKGDFDVTDTNGGTGTLKERYHYNFVTLGLTYHFSA